MTFPYPYKGPIAPLNNLPIQPQFYQPSVFTISGVSLGVLTTVTTSVSHNYVVGQEIRLIIPPTFGCRQLNEQTGFVTSIPSANQVVLNINSSMNVDPYIASPATTTAQIVAVGDVNTGANNTTGRVQTGTFVPGSFINISP